MNKLRKCHWCQFEGIYHLVTDEGAWLCTQCYHAYKRKGGRFGSGPVKDSGITDVLSGDGVGALGLGATEEDTKEGVAKDDASPTGVVEETKE